MQGLGEGANITLAIDDRALSVDFDRLRQLANNGIGFIRDTHSWSPDLIERVVRHSRSRVCKTSVLPAKDDSDVSREALLCAVDAADIDGPYFGGNLSWLRVSVRSLD